jgi:ABC-type multidrug transport system ATPase subunit
MGVPLQMANLRFAYGPETKEDQWRLFVPSLSIPERSLCSVTGDNMAGKSTLLRIIAGLESITVLEDTRFSGSLIYDGKANGRAMYRSSLSGCCYLAQSDPMFPELSLWDNVRICNQRGCKITLRDAQVSFTEYVRFLNATPSFAGIRGDVQLRQLSTGGQSVLRLARAVSWNSQVVLIDEVTSSLDGKNVTAFFASVRMLAERSNCTVLLVSHASRDHENLNQTAAQIGFNYGKIEIAYDAERQVSCVSDFSLSAQ